MKKLILALLIGLVGAAHADFKKFECDNADVDTIETVCEINMTYQFSQCQLSFTVATAVLSDFNIDFDTGNKGYITEYSVSADYTSPAGYLYYASSDLTTASTSGTHSLILDHLSTVNKIRFQAAGTNSVIDGEVICNDL